MSKPAKKIKRSAVLSCNALHRVISRHKEKFLVDMRLYPSTVVILFAQQARNVLAQHGKTIMIDGTLEIEELGLHLTTVMIQCNQLTYPVAFMLASIKSIPVYQLFFLQLKTLAKEHWNPSTIVLDYEDELRRACAIEFPRATICGDNFHFIQDNILWLENHQGKDHIDTMIPFLQDLASAHEFAALQEKMDSYFQHLTVENLGDYMEYFREVWIQKYPPNNWSSYARPSSFPVGDLGLDNWHVRLANLLNEENKERIDHIVNSLWDEWCYASKVMSNPILESQKRAESAVRPSFKRKSSPLIGSKKRKSSEGSSPTLTSSNPLNNSGSLSASILSLFSSYPGGNPLTNLPSALSLSNSSSSIGTLIASLTSTPTTTTTTTSSVQASSSSPNAFSQADSSPSLSSSNGGSFSATTPQPVGNGLNNSSTSIGTNTAQSPSPSPSGAAVSSSPSTLANLPAFPVGTRDSLSAGLLEALCSRARENLACSCGKGKINQACSLQKCIECCGSVSDKCVVNSHRQKKIEHMTSTYIALVENAIHKGQGLLIRYGSSETLMQIRPLGWVVPSVSFTANIRDDKSKRFKLEKIKELRPFIPDHFQPQI